MNNEGPTPKPSRYRLLLKLASGGMGTVYLGQQVGAAGFQRLVAIKRAHAHLLDDAEAVSMFVSEAGLASVVRHPNVVGVVDVVEETGELLLVLDYVEGGSLSQITARGRRLPLAVAVRILLDAAEGLDAVHSAKSDEGEELGLVHRDVSPQNILVGVDGVARVADFGIAKAMHSDVTASGLVRGKPGYLAPEYVTGARPTSAMDVFGMGIVAWEILTGRRLFKGANDVETLERLRGLPIDPPSLHNADIPPALDDVVMRALARDPAERYECGRDLARALRSATRISSPNLGELVDLVASYQEVGAIVQDVMGARLAERRELLRNPHTPIAAGPSHPRIPIVESETRRDQEAEVARTHASVVLPSRAAEAPRNRARVAIYALAAVALVGVSARAGWSARANGHAAAPMEAARSATGSDVAPANQVTVPTVTRPATTPPVEAPPEALTVAEATPRRHAPSRRTTKPIEAHEAQPTASAVERPPPTREEPIAPHPTLLADPPAVAPGNPYGS